MANRFEAIQVGDTAEIIHVITSEDIARFVDLTGDDNKIHTDFGYAARTSLKKPVAHGMLGASFISTVIGTKLPGDGALWFAQSLEFLLPVRVGDTLTVRATVLTKIQRDQVLELKTEILNQFSQMVTTGQAKVRFLAEAAVAVPRPTNTPGAALVIGGSGGIGSAVCLQLAEDGLDVGVHYFSNKRRAEEVASRVSELGRSVACVSADVRQEGEAIDLLARVERGVGRVGVLVYCPTTRFMPTPVEDLHWSAFNEQLNINLQGAVNVTRAVLPSMLREKAGRIIFVTSQYTDAPVGGLSHYIAAKSALNGFARALAFDLAPHGILVNLVSPGMTDTDLIADVPLKARLTAAARTPLRRLAVPADVAGAVSFLASSRSSYVAGETIRVNGGLTMM